ncbi:MAG: WD40/YVTN/BNR-like repeat-containing protein, partial [Flavobacteriaceae bacterium]
MKKLPFIGLLFGVVMSLMAQNVQEDLSAAVYRNIGPFRGGRANGVAGVSNDMLTYYMASTGGGLWKTTDAGHRWTNVSDGYFKTGSVGTVAVSESHPEIVYVGMGEHAPRGVMTSYGDGVYKSIDGGKTWKHLGLALTRHIARIIVHPTNPNWVWVAAQGALNGPSAERGIYRSTDGGATWTQVLYVNNTTGCNDLSIDVHHPEVLYASMWDHERKPWVVRSGGPGSGLYKSVASGKTWQKIENGLPKEKGKMSIAVSRADSDWVYALVESDTYAEKGGLFLSEDAGGSWRKVSGDHRLIQRAWYYIEVFPDPNNREVVNVLNASYLQSKDAGATWSRIDAYHGDYHDLWINPANSKNMAVADDGGVSITFDGGAHWTDQENMPTAQLYRVAV